MFSRFVVLASNLVHLYYYMDQAGVVPERTEMLCLPSGEMVSILVLKCPNFFRGRGIPNMLHSKFIGYAFRWNLPLHPGVWIFNVGREQILAMDHGQTGSGNFSTNSSFLQTSNLWRKRSHHSLETCM